MAFQRINQFTGCNNIAKPERLPEGAVADAVNLDFTVGGKAELRAGYSLVRKCQAGKELRAVFAMPDDSLLIVENNDLIKLRNGQEQKIGEVSTGPIAATVHNDKLYLNTQAESLEIGVAEVSPWGMAPPDFDLAVIGYGDMPIGTYKISVTGISGGSEAGAHIKTVEINTSGKSIAVHLNSNGQSRVYCSAANGTQLYHQGSASSSAPFVITGEPANDTAVLETAHLTKMPFCEILESHKGQILGASGNTLYFTRPMLPHLHDPLSGFVLFNKKITLIAPVGDGVYVCADKTYYISAIGSNEMTMRKVLDFGAVAGTQVKLPSGSVSWFSEYGQIIAGNGGEVAMVNKDTYSPEIMDSGAAVLLSGNGNQIIATTMSGAQRSSLLKSKDFWDVEVI